MSSTAPKLATSFDISALIKKLESARNDLAYDANLHHYDRHHPERSALDNTFDDLTDDLRTYLPADQIADVKPFTDPALATGDLVIVDGHPVAVREIFSHAPHSHEGSGLPQDQAVKEVLAGRKRHYLPVPLPA